MNTTDTSAATSPTLDEQLELLRRVNPARRRVARQSAPKRGSNVVQSVPGSVRGSPNRGNTLASKPVIAVIRSPTIVTTSSP